MSEIQPLRRNRRFQLLWAGGACSLLSTEIHALAFPLLILATTDSALLAGTFGAVQMAAAVTLGLPAGVFVDRHNRWLVLCCSEAFRSAVTGGVLLAVWLGFASPVLLLSAAAVLGASAPFSGAARMVMIRRVVQPEQLRTALTQDEVRAHTVGLTGPSAAGWLSGLYRAAPFVATTVLTLIGLVCALAVGRDAGRADHEPTAPQSPLRAAAHGLRVLWTQRVLRFGTLFAATSNLALAPLMLIVIVELRRQDVSATQIGLVGAALAAGGFLGTALVAPVQKRWPPGRVLLTVGLLTAALIAALSTGPGVWVTGLLLALIGMGGPTVRVLLDILIFQQVPDRERGRTVTAFMTVTGLGSSCGLMLSAVLLDQSPAVAVLLLAALLTGAVLVGFSQQAIRRAAWPEQPVA